MRSYRNERADWNNFRQDELFVDNLQRFNKRLDEEDITGALKEVAIKEYLKVLGNSLNMKVIS